jgi:peroxiredoxin
MSVHSSTAAKGQTAPDFELVDQHGDEFRLSAARERGAVVLVFLRGFA